MKKNGSKTEELAKAATGIKGFDEISQGGVPRGRTSLVFGGAGCGKTMFAMNFIANGAVEFNEPGVFFTFEETRDKLVENMKSVGFDLARLERENKIVVSHALVGLKEMVEAGEFTLEGLFIRLRGAIQKVKARRVALDTIETLFSGLSQGKTLRWEIKKLFDWLEEQGVTAIVTGEKGEGLATRQNLEEYIADCVVFLDHRVKDQISTRRLRIVKYRGTEHQTDEFPFVIDRSGIWVMPVTSVDLSYPASKEIISTGVKDLDAMFAEGGIYRGSSILLSGTAGTGKTTIASAFVGGACQRGERALFFAFEESKEQLFRNMAGIGLKLDRCEKKGLLKYVAVRPTVNGLEAHLVKMQRLIDEFDPRVLVLDPMSNFLSVGTSDDVKAMLLRLIDQLKYRQITSLFTSLTEGGSPVERTELGVSSLMDTWLLLRDIEYRGERNRGIYVLKSRGTSHSNQIREFLITNEGIKLQDVYIGPEGVLIGSARARKIEEDIRRKEREPALRRRRERLLSQKLRALENQISLLRSNFEMEEDDLSDRAFLEDKAEFDLLNEAELEYRTSTDRGSEKKLSNRKSLKGSGLDQA